MILERRGGGGVPGPSFGRGTTATVVVSMATDQSDRESERRRGRTGYGFISGLEPSGGWSQHMFPGVNTNDQSSEGAISSLGSGVADRRRSPLSNFMLNDSLRR